MTNTSSNTSSPAGRAALVTGCSSGIGHATALHLAQRGYTVFATVRKQRDADALGALGEPNLVPVCPLDLTRLEQVEQTHRCVTDELQSRGIDGLYAIVNNAGAGEIAPIELMDIEGFRTELEARILGPVALLQAFLPLIRRARGRIVWIVTPALIPIKYVGSIHVADFAVNCLARTLTLELRPWDIPNILIRCGGINTAAPGKSAQELDESFRTWLPDRLALYREALLKEQQELAEFDKKRTQPEEVAKVVYRALAARRPRPRYRIGYMAGLAATLELVPQTAADAILERRG